MADWDWEAVRARLERVRDPDTSATLSVEQARTVLGGFGEQVVAIETPLGAFEPYALIVGALEHTCRAAGTAEDRWEFLLEVARRLDWTGTEAVPLADVIARWTVRTSVDGGVAAIPRGALVHLGRLSASLGTDVTAPRHRGYYGWGTGHPKEPVRDNIRAAAQAGDSVFVVQTLTHAFYANQSQAIRTYERVMDYPRTIDLDLLQASLAALSDPQRFPPVIRGPPGWHPSETDLPPFGWDERVLERVRSATPEGVVSPDVPRPTLD